MTRTQDREEYEECIELLTGSRSDKRLLLGFLLTKICNEEYLNFGYRQMLQVLREEFENETI